MEREGSEKMKNTDELTHEIQMADDIVSYFEKNRDEMQICTLPEYLQEWLERKELTRADVVRHSNLNKAYVYQIFSGKKFPSRDKVIETQSLLKQAGHRELYPRDPRDALLLFAFSKKMSIIDANELLYDHEIEVLE